MGKQNVRLLIRKMLQSGRLPYDSASRESGSPAAGQVCAACGTFHFLCFALCKDERRKPREQIA
jgi:hypothetical protein